MVRPTESGLTSPQTSVWQAEVAMRLGCQPKKIMASISAPSQALAAKAAMREHRRKEMTSLQEPSWFCALRRWIDSEDSAKD